jgi:hypothetical protein
LRPSLGLAPRLSLVIAGGVGIVAYADYRARLDAPGAIELFWVGLLVMFLPVFARLMARGVSRQETMTLLAMLVVAFYVVKVLLSPTMFTVPDESAHWRTANDILKSGHLFLPNPLLPITARYPGLEMITVLVVDVTGLSIFDAGLIVVVVARLVLVLSLFLFFEVVGRSTRVAGIAAILYMTNPNFLFFGAQFKYETLALALAALTIYLVARRSRPFEPDRRAWTILATVILAATAATHHLTSYAVIGFLLLWVLVGRLIGRLAEPPPQYPIRMRPVHPAPGQRPPRPERTYRGIRRERLPSGMALVGAIINLGWLGVVAPGTVAYLAPVLSGAFVAGLQLVGAKLGLVKGSADIGRDVFANPPGLLASPLWERYVALASVLLILVGITWGGFRVIRRYRANPLTLTLVGGSAVYPVMLLFRLTERGWETSNRSSEILYVGMAFLLAVGFIGARSLVRSRRAGLGLALVASGAMLIGGVFSGWDFHWRLPWPYDVGESPRAIEAQGVEAAYWMRDQIGPGQRIGADDTNRRLLGSLGEQQVMSTISGGINALWVIYSPVLDQDKIDLLRSGRVEYLLIDRRLAARPELFKAYFPDPRPVQALSKFDRIAGISRIFDSGDIAIYDVRSLSGAQ